MNPARRAPEGAADRLRALRRAKVFELWDCGLWVWVFLFLFGRVGLVVFSFVVRQLLPKLNKNGTNIDPKWDHSGPGGRKGQPKINTNIIKLKNANAKNQNKNKLCF